jgi:hypothetical protein
MMNVSDLITIALIAIIVIGGIISVIVTSKRQKARKDAAPSRHRGEFQLQKDRVFKKGSTDHNDAPTSPS